MVAALLGISKTGEGLACYYASWLEVSKNHDEEIDLRKKGRRGKLYTVVDGGQNNCCVYCLWVPTAKIKREKM